MKKADYHHHIDTDDIFPTWLPLAGALVEYAYGR
jgi:hypothetical protein